MYSTQLSLHSLDNHTRKSHLTAHDPAAGGRDSTDARRDEGSSSSLFSKLADGATGLYHSAGKAVSGAVETVGGVTANAYRGAVNLTNTASGYVQRTEHGVTRGLHAAEDWVDQGSHGLAGRAANVPVLGPVAGGIADLATVGTQVVGGVLGGAATLGGGIANTALHPIDTVAGVEAMAEHTPGPLGAMARGTHDVIDVARGRQTIDGMINRAVNPLATAQEDAQFWGRMGSAIIDPYRQSVNEGRYGEALGRGVFDVGSMLIGAGEVGDAARGVGVASDVAQAADAADAAGVAGRAGETAHVLDATADATRAAETTVNATLPVDATAEALTASEGSLSPRAEPRMAPPEPDVGLSDRGYRPSPAERAETRQQYRERRSRERAEATVSAADQPLENPRPNAAQHGHGHGRHGWQTTDAQQADRVVSGRFPEQHPTEAPGGPPRARASHFGSPQAEAEALGRGRRALQRDLDAGTVPTHLDPVTGAPTYVDPVTGEPVRHEALVSTNRPGGFGNSQVVRRQPPPSTALAPDTAGNRVAVPSSTALPNATVVHEYIPSTGKWRTVTHYPEPAPLPNGQMPIR